MTELEELRNLYCEMHKDVYGVKARWYQPASVEQAKQDLARLEQSLIASIAADELAAEKAVKEFNEFVRTCPDLQTAIRWQHDAYNTAGDNEFLEYHLGLPYGYLSRLTNG